MLFSTSTVALAALSFLGMAAAQPAVARDDATVAYVRIEKNLGTAFGDVTQKTVPVPIGSVYTNEADLAEVSTLYLMGATGVAKESVTCIPYGQTTGSGTHGLAFTVGTPSYLSTNTVVVGSIVCTSA